MSKRQYTPWKTLEKGVRYYDHMERKHGVKPDRYFALRYTVDGQRIEEGLGWSSQGWNLAKARTELAKLITAQATGEGAATLQEKRAKAKAAREEEREKPTIARLWELFYASGKDTPGMKTNTYNIKHLAAFYEKTPDQIRTAHIEALRRQLEEEGKAAQTVKHVLGLLRRIIRYGAQRGLCPMPEMSRLHFTMPRIDNQKTECLTPEQAKALFEALDADPNQNLAAMVRLALATGMRKGALLGLQWPDIDFRQGIITLRGDAAKKGRTEHIPMTEAARAILQNIENLGSEFVFPGKNGGKRVEIRRFLNRIRDAAGLPEGFRPLHGLRHTYASWLASSGKVDLLTLQKLLTHESPNMTMRYAHLADEAVKRAASVIDECFDVAANAEAPRPQGAKVVPFARAKK